MAKGFKTGGRAAGVKNKNTSLINTFINYAVDGGFEKFKSEMNSLTGKQYCLVFLKLSNIATEDSQKLMANKKIIDLYNEKIKQNGTNK
jgi:hypothetical protein